MRYRKLHKLCRQNGYYVNDSVFEFEMKYDEFLKLKHDVEKIIDGTCDSVRIYIVEKNRTENNTLLFGKKEVIEINDETSVW